MKIYLSLAVLFFAALANAGAGEIAVIDDPNPAGYQLNEGERLIMVVPSVDATSRYVPPEQAFGGASAAADTQYARQPRMQPRQQQPGRPVAARPAPRREAAPVTEVAVDGMESEVANQTFRRARGEKEEATKADKIPWWKGGLWRNRNRDEEKDEEPPPARRRSADADSGSRDRNRDDDPVAARRNRDSARSSSYDDGEGMWDDRDPYGDSYNSDYDPYGDQANTPRRSGYADDPYADPYARGGGSSGGFDPYPAPAQSAYDPYAQPYPQQTQSAYGTDPNAPLGAYVDSVYGTVPAIDASTGQPVSPQYSGGYVSDPYAVPPAPYTGGYDGGFVTGGMASQSDPFGALPTAALSSAYEAQGGPQFENAVRMVKENRFTEAKAILASETSRNPSNAAAWRWLADCYYNLLELDDAIQAYQRSLDLDHSDYYALRGQGFSYLHRGHEYWRRMQEEVAQNRKEAAASTFALAHNDYKKALEMLGLCLRRVPNDGEAIYGEAMAAEGASRKLYSNAISFLKLGPDQRERAELFAENCLTVINKGIEQSRARSAQVPGDSGPRALLGGLYLRKATLYHQLGKNDLALIELRNARDAQRAILDEIDKNNSTAQRAVREIESLWDQWGGNA